MYTRLKFDLPAEITAIITRLEDSGHQAYLVGGAVRDLCRGVTPHDWDICTSARPEEMLALFADAFSIGAKFGTVTVPTQTCGQVEITTFRREGPYSDGRHPDYVEFSSELSSDLARRDFTCNALAYHPLSGLVDLFGGLADLEQGILRSVGEAKARLAEDKLRILRAFRFQLFLGLRLEAELKKAICQLAPLVANLPVERIGGEMRQILAHPEAYKAIRRMRVTGVLDGVLPELAACYGLVQNQYHAYTVYSHTIVTMKHCLDDLEVRTAMLLHDLGKGVIANQSADGIRRFWGHHEVSAQLAEAILRRWAWPSRSRERIVTLVREHMFYWPDAPSEKALRRFIAKVGPDLVLSLMEVRKADIIGLGPQGKRRLWPWNILRNRISAMLEAEEVFSLRDLALDGNDLIEHFQLAPGPLIGQILDQLLDAVISEEVTNERRALLEYARRFVPDGE